MNDKMKNVLLWIIAVVLTLSLVVYQRATGPTYPIKGKTEIDGEKIAYRFLRSHDTEINAPVDIKLADKDITGQLSYKRYKSYDEWTTIDMKPNDEGLVSELPYLPAAGKMMYNVVLFKDGVSYPLNDEPVVLRYKGAVPISVLTPHVFFMFFSLLFGVRAGMEALFRRKDTLFQAGVALFTVIIGGLILGPIVQKYAFDAYWTGWPFGTDLTDNKTAVIFLFWLIAWLRLRKQPGNKVWPVIATIVMLIVYVIPHSVLGSEIDYTKQQTEQLKTNEDK
jgi:hypothetical protein